MAIGGFHRRPGPGYKVVAGLGSALRDPTVIFQWEKTIGGFHRRPATERFKRALETTPVQLSKSHPLHYLQQDGRSPNYIHPVKLLIMVEELANRSSERLELLKRERNREEEDGWMDGWCYVFPGASETQINRVNRWGKEGAPRKGHRGKRLFRRGLSIISVCGIQSVTLLHTLGVMIT